MIPEFSKAGPSSMNDAHQHLRLVPLLASSSFKDIRNQLPPSKPLSHSISLGCPWEQNLPLVVEPSPDKYPMERHSCVVLQLCDVAQVRAGQGGLHDIKIRRKGEKQRRENAGGGESRRRK